MSRRTALLDPGRRATAAEKGTTGASSRARRQQPRVTVVFVHGAWHGPWCWTRLRHQMFPLGWRTRVVQLPSATSSTADLLPGLQEDVTAIGAAIEQCDGPVVVVAHSYGGAPATEAVARHTDKVAHLVFLAAYTPRVGENLFFMHGQPTPTEMDGAVPVPGNPITMLYHDVDPSEAADAVAQLVPQSVRSWAEPAQAELRGDVQTSYLICDDDRALPPPMQEQFAARTGSVRRLHSGHSPFLSHPGALAGVLDDILVAVRS